MSDVATATTTPITGAGIAPSKGLVARAFGVIFAPRETYAAIAAHPRIFGAAVTTLVLAVSATVAFLLTQVGQDALWDQQMRAMDSMQALGFRINDQMLDRMESQLTMAPYFSAAGQLVLMPVVWTVLSGALFGVFNVLFGGEATFKQVYAIVVHGGFLIALQQLFVNPLNYVRHSMSSPTTLAAFVPFLDNRSFPALLLGGLDLFFIWLIINQAIGMGVLYKKRTAPIALTMLGIYVAIVLVVAGVRTALSGGAS